LIGGELLRLDLEHAGYGVFKSTLPLVRIIDNGTGSSILEIRSTLNSTNQKTMGWALIDRTTGSWKVVYDAIDNISGDTSTYKIRSYVAVAIPVGNFDVIKTSYNQNIYNSNIELPDYPYYLIFPFDNSSANGCDNNSFCNKITYKLDSSGLPDQCNPNTKNLKRYVGNSTSGNVVISCVSDIEYRAFVDKNYNGAIDTGEYKSTLDNNSDLNFLKSIDVYILVQDSKYNPKYTFYNNVDNGSVIYDDLNGNGKCDSGEICLSLPVKTSDPKTDYRRYKWKIEKISVEPKNIRLRNWNE
jgi:type IV pilus assembly protein PilW